MHTLLVSASLAPNYADSRHGFVPLARVAKVIGALPSPRRALGARAVEPSPVSPLPTGHELSTFDVIIVSSSAGKDSSVALEAAYRECKRLGLLDRLVVVHADLGSDEWLNTGALAHEQAQRLGLPFFVVSRIGQEKKTSAGSLYSKGERFGNLEDYVIRRKAAHRRGDQASKPAWYSPAIRFCTSEFKRAPLRAFTTAMSKAFRAEHKERTGEKLARPVKVMSVQVLRASESANRAKLDAFKLDKGASSKAKEVYTWLPIHGWSDQQVWATIRDEGIPYHFAYDRGMPRLSCTLCMFAPEDALMLGGLYNREALAGKVDVEIDTGDTFKANLALADVDARIEAGEFPTELADWTM